MTAVNVIHITGTGSGLTAATAFNALDAHVTQTMWGPVGTNASVIDCAITPLDGVSGTVHFSPTGLKWEGAASSGNFQPQVAAIIKLSTGERGRNKRGRVYLPFIPTTSLGDGSISGSVPTTTTSAWAAFLTALIGNTPEFNLVVAAYDRKHSGAGATVTNVNNVLCEALTGTQRKRQGRVRGA